MVTISKERYEELVRAETVLDVLADVVAQDAADYLTTKVVRTILGPYMKPQPTKGGAPDAE